MSSGVPGGPRVEKIFQLKGYHWNQDGVESSKIIFLESKNAPRLGNGGNKIGSFGLLIFFTKSAKTIQICEILTEIAGFFQ